MTTKHHDVAIGAVVITLAVAAVAYFLTRGDACLDKASDFVSAAPAVTDRTGTVVSVGTSSWLSGQAAAGKGQRSFYLRVKGRRATANVIVSADRDTCTCRIDAIH